MREDLQAAFEAGADDFLVKPVNPPELLSRVRLHTHLRATLQRTTDLQSLVHFGDQPAQAALEGSQEILASTLLKLTENRDNETGEHLLRMSDYAVLLAEELRRDSEYADQIDDSFIADLDRACPLHDIGKVGIPDEILLKPGRLTPEEFDVIKEHTSICGEHSGTGRQSNEWPWLSGNGSGNCTISPRCRDGRGYPSGLSKQRIPLSARIVAVADVYASPASGAIKRLGRPLARGNHRRGDGRN